MHVYRLPRFIHLVTSTYTDIAIFSLPTFHCSPTSIHTDITFLSHQLILINSEWGGCSAFISEPFTKTQIYFDPANTITHSWYPLTTWDADNRGGISKRQQDGYNLQDGRFTGKGQGGGGGEEEESKGRVFAPLGVL